MELNVEQLKKSDFEAACNSAFMVSTIEQPTTTFPFTLTTLTTRSAPSGFEQFSLIFAGPPEPLLPQGTYRFMHDDLGELPLFMVPIGRNALNVQYEVCISRRIEND